MLDKAEAGITVLFDVELIIRAAGMLPDWRSFFRKGQNWLDLVLAIGSTILLIPVVHNSGAYPWLTIFELGRFYRVILEIPRMRPLLVRLSPPPFATLLIFTRTRSSLCSVTCTGL